MERNKDKASRIALAGLALVALGKSAYEISSRQQGQAEYESRPSTEPTPLPVGPALPEELVVGELTEQLLKAEKAGAFVSNINPSTYKSGLPELSELGVESRDWWLLESGDFLVTKATYLGSVEEKIHEGRVLLLAFTREEGKILWVAGPVEFLETEIPLRLGSDNAPQETWPYRALTLNEAKQELSVGQTYILDLWRRNPLQGWGQFENPEDILDFFNRGGYPKGDDVRRQVLEGFLIPASFAAGFGTEYTSDNVRSGSVSLERTLPLNHLIEENTTLLDIPFK